ncbi:hypothetical protein MalM25_32760 [Planctomycetes bacterium MalM25]|nr:hypothetical protein MalM25_32760 [Planctomycetes bacterium MalM25]
MPADPLHPLETPTDAALADPRRWSVVTLVAANVLPLLGVLFLGWRAFDVVFLYWLENVVIGVINVLKILTCWPDSERMEERFAEENSHLDEDERAQLEQLAGDGLAWQSSKLFFAPFFAVHYGGFCAVHGIFVCVLLGGDGPFGGMPMNPVAPALEALQRPGILLAAIALGASHLVSYFTNFLGRGEYRRATPVDLMAKPYGRVVVLHLAIVLSGFLTVALGSPIWLLVLLVAGKTWLDLKLHQKEHAEGASEELRAASW